MSDSILLKYNNPEEKKIVFSPRDGGEMERAMKGCAPIHLYSDLCSVAKKFGATRMLAALFRTSEKHIILLQDPNNMSSGHWFSISRNLPKKEIYFFSTYGGKPDREKIAWIDENDLRKSGQDINIFNDTFQILQKHGWEIHYNDYPYQKPNDKTAVCGIYTVAFLRSGLNPDEFEKQTLKIAKSGINPAVYYFKKFF